MIICTPTRGWEELLVKSHIFQSQIADAAWHNCVNTPEQRHTLWFHSLVFPILGAQESPQNNILLSQRSTEQWGRNPISFSLPKDHIIKFWLYDGIAPGWFPASLQFYCQLAGCFGIDWICQGFLQMGGQDLTGQVQITFHMLILSYRRSADCLWMCFEKELQRDGTSVYPGPSNCSAWETSQGPCICASQSPHGQ